MPHMKVLPRISHMTAEKMWRNTDVPSKLQGFPGRQGGVDGCGRRWEQRDRHVINITSRRHSETVSAVLSQHFSCSVYTCGMCRAAGQPLSAWTRTAADKSRYRSHFLRQPIKLIGISLQSCVIFRAGHETSSDPLVSEASR